MMIVAYAVITVVAAIWVWSFAAATSKIPSRPPIRLDGPSLTTPERRGRPPGRVRKPELSSSR